LACFGRHANDLRDHIAGPLHDHRVADADILAGDFIGVVQGRVHDDHSADRDRGEASDRRHRAGAPDLQVDGPKQSPRLLGRKLAGHSPARGA